MPQKKIPEIRLQEQHIEEVVTRVFEEHPELDHLAYHTLYEPYQGANNCCFQCEHCYYGCSWSNEFKPIKGWIAEDNPGAKSKKIFYCPEFKQSSDNLKINIDYECAIKFLCFFAKDTADRYKYVLRKITKYRELFPEYKHVHDFVLSYRLMLSEKDNIENLLSKFYIQIQNDEGFEPYNENDVEVLKPQNVGRNKII